MTEGRSLQTKKRAISAISATKTVRMARLRHAHAFVSGRTSDRCVISAIRHLVAEKLRHMAENHATEMRQ